MNYDKYVMVSQWICTVNAPVRSVYHMNYDNDVMVSQWICTVNDPICSVYHMNHAHIFVLLVWVIISLHWTLVNHYRQFTGRRYGKVILECIKNKTARNITKSTNVVRNF